MILYSYNESGGEIMETLNIFSMRLKELRNDYEMTQKDFSVKVGCTAATLSAYENGTKNPSLEIVKNIAEKCNVSIDWLCGLSEKKTLKDDIFLYSELFSLLMKFDSITDLDLILTNTEAIGLESKRTNGSLLGITFDNSVVQEFLEDWKKMKELYQSNTIDEEVYLLWVEKTINKYNFPTIKLSKNDTLERI